MSEPDPVSPRLGPREPRPLLVHVAVDAAVAFLLSVVLLLILGMAFWMVLIVAALLGLAAAPYTRRAEERALAARDRGADG